MGYNSNDQDVIRQNVIITADSPYVPAPLPYAMDALEPYIKEHTLFYHYNKHLMGYVNNLNKLVASNPKYQNKSLLDIMTESYANKDDPVFNNSAQIWNHTLYWHSLRPYKGEVSESDIPQPLSGLIKQSFGSFDNLLQKISSNTLFGSGYLWIVLTNNQSLEIVQTANAVNPIVTVEGAPLLAIDLWEHSYYLDTRNKRNIYTNNVIKLINWEFANNAIK